MSGGVDATMPISEEAEEEQYTEEEKKLLENDNLPQSLKYVERILNQSAFHKQIVVYRNYPELKVQVERNVDDGNKRMGGAAFRAFKQPRLNEGK